jgi:peptide deformylase
MTDNIIKIDTNPYKDGPAIEPVIETFSLVPETHPALKKVMPNFDFNNPPVNPNRFASSLVETCKKHNGLGLSANQCGYEYRVFVMGSNDSYVAFFNPEIIWSSEETIRMEEGCLSFQDLFLNIERPIGIRVKYQDFSGETKEAMFAGLTARCFQHEMNHMNGIVYTHLAKPLALQMAIKKRSKLTVQGKKLEKKITEKVKKLTRNII